MTEPPVLAVFGSAEAFAEAWAPLAARLAMSMVREEEPVALSGRPVAAVILSCGGEEDRAIDRLHEAYRAGIEAPLVIGAEPDHRLAVELMARGAAGYFALPGDLERLEAELGRRLQAIGRSPSAATGPVSRAGAFDFRPILGEDPSLGETLEQAARVIPGGRATVLITGETGTGKELLAQAIHRNGPRGGQPFVAVNCSAIPANLLESELFGHEKGAFTDARASKPGLFEAAEGGTLFLDEVSTLPLELQGKLLRVLETREVRRVGGVRSNVVDVRILAAANVNLLSEVREGRFREDLYYRLAVVTLKLPALRERGDDPLLLARHFLSRLSEEYGLPQASLTPEAVAAIRRHTWPGNIRELRNAIERALLMSDGPEVGPEALALDETPGTAPPAVGGPLPFPATLEEIEVAAARAALELSDGNKSAAARLLGTTRTRLYRLLEAEEEL